jgi:hypothetical protein
MFPKLSPQGYTSSLPDPWKRKKENNSAAEMSQKGAVLIPWGGNALHKGHHGDAHPQNIPKW